MSTHSDIEQQLRDAITQSGRSLNQLGQAASVDSGRLSRFMRGERGLTLQAVTQLCRVLGLHLCADDETAKDTGKAQDLEPGRSGRAGQGKAAGPAGELPPQRKPKSRKTRRLKGS